MSSPGGTTASNRPMWARLVWLSIGCISVVLGVLGAFLPLLPTTPFLLLAAFCFARSSQRFHDWLLQHKWLGRYIKNFREKRGMTRRDKAVTLVMLWLAMGSSIVFLVKLAWVKGLLAGIVVIETAFLLFRVKTCEEDGDLRAPEARASGGSLLNSALSGQESLDMDPGGPP